MNRQTDYDWNHSTELPERSFVCGFCGKDITSRSGFTGWMRVGGAQLRQDIYICHSCGQPNFISVADEQIPKYKVPKTTFSDAVTSISPRFIEIYKQSDTAEDEGLDEIAGPGYGKALEFLVKDYLIKNLPGEEAEIKSMSLYNCIHDKLDNPKIKALADRARVLRNDETHYERKYEESDITDLKKLINATVAWIELESFTAEVTLPKQAEG